MNKVRLIIYNEIHKLIIKNQFRYADSRLIKSELFGDGWLATALELY